VATKYTDVMELDLGTIVPCLAGPKRPHDRVAVSDMKTDFNKVAQRALLCCPIVVVMVMMMMMMLVLTYSCAITVTSASPPLWASRVMVSPSLILRSRRPSSTRARTSLSSTVMW